MVEIKSIHNTCVPRISSAWLLELKKDEIEVPDGLKGFPVIKEIMIGNFTEPTEEEPETLCSVCLRITVILNDYKILIAGSYTETGKKPVADFSYNMHKSEHNGFLVGPVSKLIPDCFCRPIKYFTEEVAWLFGKLGVFFIEYLREREISFSEWKEEQPKFLPISEVPIPKELEYIVAEHEYSKK